MGMENTTINDPMKTVKHGNEWYWQSTTVKGKGSKLPKKQTSSSEVSRSKMLGRKRWNSDLRLLQFLDFKTSPFFHSNEILGQIDAVFWIMWRGAVPFPKQEQRPPRIGQWQFAYLKLFFATWNRFVFVKKTPLLHKKWLPIS